MAEYRTVKKGAWRDVFTLSLKPNEKLLYLWLFTNDYVNCAGLQEINENIMRFETGFRYPINTLSILHEKGKIVMDGDLVWVRNFIKSQFKTISPKLEAGIIRCLAACPSKTILYEFGKTYGQIPYPYPIDTPPIPQGSTLIPCNPDTLNTLDTKDTLETRGKKHREYPACFERLWKYHPKGGKDAAYRAMKTIDPNEAELDRWIRKLEACKATDQWRRGVSPNLSTWINQGYFDGEIPVSANDLAARDSDKYRVCPKCGWYHEIGFECSRQDKNDTTPMPEGVRKAIGDVEKKLSVKEKDEQKEEDIHKQKQD